MIGGSRSKIITVSMRLTDAQNDSAYFDVPGEISDPNAIREVVKKKYLSDSGISECSIDGDRIILQWYPENVDKDGEVLFAEAKDALKKKQHERAIAKLEMAVEKNGEDVDYLYTMGLIYYELKKFQDSFGYLKKAVQICPIHFKAHLLLGINLMKLRKFDEAEIHVLESNRLNRSNVLSFLNLGAIYSIQRRYNEAIQMFNSTIQLAPNESRAYLGLARIYNMLNDVEASNGFFRKVIELAPGTSIAEYAKRSIQVSNIKKPTNVNTLNSREEQFSKAMGYYLSGNHKNANEMYKQYLSNNPSDDYAWYLLGETLFRTGDTSQAVDSLKRAIRINSKRGIYYKSLGLAFYLDGKTRESIEIFKKAMELGKKDPLSMTLQGINFMRQRKFDEAISHLKTALKQNPNNPLALYNLALCKIQMEEKEEAVELLEKISKMEYYIPLKENAKKALSNLESEV